MQRVWILFRAMWDADTGSRFGFYQAQISFLKTFQAAAQTSRSNEIQADKLPVQLAQGEGLEHRTWNSASCSVKRLSFWQLA